MKIILKKGQKIFVRIPEITVTLSTKDIEFDESEVIVQHTGQHGNMYTYIFTEPYPKFQGLIARGFYFYDKHNL